jgi:hypothetical protein
MNEAIFPLLGTAFVMLVVLPACALVAKLILATLERDALSGPFHGLGLRYLLLTGSTVLPLAWFLSAGMHQAESGQSMLACLFDHETTARCFEPGLFVLTMFAVMLALGVQRLRRLFAGNIPRPLALADEDEVLRARLEQIIAAHPGLQLLRVRVTTAPEFSIATSGLLRPVVLVGTAFASRVPDDVLASALGHEREHVRSLDPLRYLLLELALALNPFGRALLQPHVARWYGAREAHCDRTAVVGGCAALPLAEAIVQAARPTAPHVPALGAHDAKLLELRVKLLFAFAERCPARCCRHESSAVPVAFLLLLLTLLLPHQTSTAALDALHTGSEHALAHFWR